MARSKRQTRLAFNPLPTSSPTTSAAVQEHGQRSYASVGYEGSQRQSKRRRIVKENADNENNLGLPTPVKSSQLPTSTKASLDQATGRTSANPPRRTRAQQGRLDFTNHIGVQLGDSEAEHTDGDTSSDSSDDLKVMARTKTPARPRPVGMFSSSSHRKSYGHESEDELPSSTPRRSSPLKRLRQGRKKELGQRKSLRSTEKHNAKDDSGEDVVVGVMKRRRSSVVEISDGEAESSGDDVPALYSSPARKRQKKRTTTKSYTEDDGFVVLSDVDEDDAPVNKTLAEIRSRKTRATKSTKEASFMVSDDEETATENEEEALPSRSRRLRRGPRKGAEQDRKDIEHDLEDLKSSSPDAQARPKRKADPRKEALEALKRRRAGLDGPSSPTVHNRRLEPVSGDSSNEEENRELSEDEGFEVAAAARRHGALDGEDEGDDFVVSDDEDEPLGAPNNVDVELPMLLTGITRMKPKELFRFAVEWMVQKKLNPAYNQEREKYDVTFKRLDDEVRGLAGSKFTSSAWTRDFTISLQARPGVELAELHGLRSEVGLDKCQACNRSGHPATYQIQFTGRPYDPQTLEPMEQDGDEVESEDDIENDSATSRIPREEYDHKSRLVPPESTVYNVGRFCKENAMTAHALEHWKFQLNCWIVEKLEEDGHLTDRKVVKRDRWDEPRRRKYAKKVVEVMEENGDVKQLWKQFREEIDNARESKSGWQREKEREF